MPHRTVPGLDPIGGRVGRQRLGAKVVNHLQRWVAPRGDHSRQRLNDRLVAALVDMPPLPLSRYLSEWRMRWLQSLSAELCDDMGSDDVDSPGRARTAGYERPASAQAEATLVRNPLQITRTITGVRCP